MSGTGDWRSRRWEATHQRIYDVALQLFQEHGFEQVSVAQIASGAGVSVPTFYAHYPSKERLVMRLPSADDFAALLAGSRPTCPSRTGIRQAMPQWLTSWTPGIPDDELARWRIVAATPALRTRAAEFERTSGGVVADALPPARRTPPPADAIVINAYMSAYTAALLAWADCDGEHKLEELMEESFDALGRR